MHKCKFCFGLYPTSTYCCLHIGWLLYAVLMGMLSSWLVLLHCMVVIMVDCCMLFTRFVVKLYQSMHHGWLLNSVSFHLLLSSWLIVVCCLCSWYCQIVTGFQCLSSSFFIVLCCRCLFVICCHHQCLFDCTRPLLSLLQLWH